MLRINIITAAAILLAAPAVAQTSTNVALSHTFSVSTYGVGLWNYTVQNAGAAAIDANRRYTIKIAVPGPHKVIYTDTLNAPAKWACEPPYNTNPGGTPNLKRSGPAIVVCHFDAANALAPGGKLPVLRINATGGDPARYCAVAGVRESNAASAPEIADTAPANNESCRGDKPADYDLAVGVIVRSTVQGGTTYHVFRPSVENKGPAAVPPFSTLESPEGSGGLSYKARIPAGTVIDALEIYQGWRCKVPGVAPNFMEDWVSVPLNGDPSIRYTSNGSLPSVKLAVDAFLTCEFRTPYPFNGYDYLGPDLAGGSFYSGSIAYTTRNWPASDPVHCATIASLNPKIAENQAKLTNNTACWNTVTNQSVAPAQ